MNISLSPFVPENLVSRDGFSSPRPSSACSSLYSEADIQAESGVSRFPHTMDGGPHSFLTYLLYTVHRKKTPHAWHKEEEEASRRRATKRDFRDLEPPTYYLLVGVGNGLAGANPAVNTPPPIIVGVCVCVFFPSILDIKFVGRTSRGHTGGRSHRIFNPPSFCGACLDFCREKDSAIPFPRRP